MDLRVETQHYVFKMHVSEDPTIHSVSIHVGDDKKPCLLLNITTPSSHDEVNERFTDVYNNTCSIARLSKIEALAECANGEVTSNYMEKYSFGYEMLQALIFIVMKNYPFVKKVQLNDKSYIPCNRAFNDTVDLNTYSIAMHGITWYEKVLNAYIEDATTYAEYKSQIANYVSKENKNQSTFDTIAHEITKNGIMFAKQQLHKHYNKWRVDFENAKTFPEFFKTIVADVAYNEKCMLFKEWLEAFIGSQVTIHREWVFDIQSNYTVEIKHANKEAMTRLSRGDVTGGEIVL
jgi:hypothetical protein